jgi:hypothetical protein
MLPSRSTSGTCFSVVAVRPTRLALVRPTVVLDRRVCRHFDATRDCEFRVVERAHDPLWESYINSLRS